MIYIKAYLRSNLGDDLFIKLLSDRYENANFLAICSDNYHTEHYKNIKFLRMGKFNELLRRVSSNNFSLETHLMAKSDSTIVIGGSMFMENEYTQKPKYPNKKYYILGSNFGPYKTEEYYNKYHNVFSQAQDVCFREEYSYNLFKDLPNVRYASDIVFSLDTSNIKMTDNKKVVMSVVDCNRKAKPEFKKGYENKIIDMIKLFDKKGYEVVLMSYCKAEGDEDAIKSILSQITDDELKNKVKTYFYDGNIEEALDVMADCQVVVGTRFHANILGFVLNKTVIPVAYSDKTLNVLKDMNFEGKVFDIRDLESFDVDSLTDDDLKYKLNVDFQREDAQRHFEKLDKVLERKGKNE